MRVTESPETDALGNLQVVYTHGVDGLVSSRAGVQSYFYHFDGLGSTRAMTNAQAQLVEVYDYEAFGNQLLSQGGVATPYRYVGQLGYYRHDDEELDLLGARYYAPEFGRFLTRDPVFGVPAANTYSYCSADPVNLADPSGLWDCSTCKRPPGKDVWKCIVKCGAKCARDPLGKECRECLADCLGSVGRDAACGFLVCCYLEGNKCELDQSRVDYCQGCCDYKKLKCMCKAKSTPEFAGCRTAHQACYMRCELTCTEPD